MISDNTYVHSNEKTILILSNFRINLFGIDLAKLDEPQGGKWLNNSKVYHGWMLPFHEK